MKNATKFLTTFALLIICSLKVLGQSPVTSPSFGNACLTTADVSWTNPGTVNTLLVFAKAGSAVTVGTPTSDIAVAYPAASANFGTPGSPYQNDASAFLVYKNTSGTSVSITGLSPGIAYHFLIFNANGTTYSTATTVSGSTLSTPGNATGFATSSITNSTINLSWTDPTTCFDEVLIVGKTSSVTGSPTGGAAAYPTTSLNYNTAIAPDFDAGAKVLYKGTNATPTITNLTGGTSYFFKIFTRKTSTWSAGVELSATTLPSPATGGSFTSACVNIGTVSWTNPSPTNTILVFAKAGSAITVGTPTANISTYTTASTNLLSPGTAYENDAAAFLVYNNTSGTSANLTGLSAGTTYRFLVFNATGTNYSSALTFNNSTLSSPPDVTGYAATPQDGSIDLNWTNPTCSDNVLIVARQGASITGTPTGTTYTGNLNFVAATNGTGFPATEKIVYFGNTPPITVTNLTNGTSYRFKAFTVKGTAWSAGTEITSTPIDLTPPTITTTDPLDNAINVATDETFSITFSENVVISSAASVVANDDKIRIRYGGGPTTDLTIDRSSVTVVGNVATFTLSPALTQIGTLYHVRIGNKVFEDTSGNPFAGITNTTDWNFTTSSGVSRTQGSATANTATFTTLSPIVLTENGKNDFATGNNKTLKIAFNGTGYIFDATALPSITFAPSANITSASVTSLDFTSLLITYTVTNTNKLDVLTISGLKVKTSSSGNPAVDIVRVAGASDGVITNAGLSSVFGTVSSCSTASPVLTGVGLGAGNSICLNSPLGGKSISATGSGSIKWYNDAGLTSEIVALAGNTNPSLAALGITNTPVGTQSRYATLTSGCQSAATGFIVNVSPLPTADAGVNKTGASAVCPGSSVVLGGSPTLTNAIGPGPYTYSWTGPSGFTSNLPNPILTALDPGAVNQTYQYNVVISEGSTSCSSSPATIQVTVKTISEVLAFTPADGSSFLTTSPSIDLLPSISPGDFSGIGVLTVPNSPGPPPQKTQFSPAAAGAGTFPIKYDAVLANGCPKSVTNTYTVFTGFTFYNYTNLSNGTTGALPSEFCNNESIVEVKITTTALQNIINYVHTWNTTYVPLYGYSPIAFNGQIRNYYEFGQYGYGANGSVTYPGGTYAVSYTDPADGLTKIKNLPRTFFDPKKLVTGNAYPTNANFNRAYLMAYMEFVSAAATAPYSIPANTDLSYAFNIGGSTGTTSISYSGSSINVNPVPIVTFSGLTSGLVSPNQFCNLSPALPFKVTGNKPNGNSGFFEISLDGTVNSYVKASPSPALGLDDLNNGTANFDPQASFAAAGNPGTAQSVYIRYNVDPGTTGSVGTNKCIGTTPSQLIFVNPLPDLNWDASVQPDNSNFCYEGTQTDLKTDKSTNVVFGGFGVVNNSNSTGYFVPKVGFDQKAPGGSTLIQTINNISATYTDALGCKNTITRLFNVYPKPVSIFTPNNKTSYCFDDPIQPITGNSATSNYTVRFLLTTPYDSIFNSQNFSFNPKGFYNSAVKKGGSSRSDIQFLVSYTTSDGIGCTSSFAKTFTVSPKIDVGIAGVAKNEVYCANTGARTITLTPKNGDLKVDGLTVPLTNNGDTYILSKPNGGIGTKLLYSITSGITGCVSKDSTFVNILPSPSANFTVPNQCSGIPVNFSAVNNINNKYWRWDFNDGTPRIAGNAFQSTQHTFTTSIDRTFGVQLYVEADPALPIYGSKVCKDSVTRNVIVGAIPEVDFDFINVCETDQTNFEIKLLNPLSTSLSQAKWAFGDGILTSSGALNASITGVTNTSGIFSKPNHQYQTASNFSVTATGTSIVGCVASNTRSLSILKKVISSPASIYAMTPTNASDWKVEDRRDSTTWTFAIPNKPNFKPTNQAWVTNASSLYKANDQSYVNSPCFDLSAFTKPAISLDYWTDTERGIDGTVLQYSVDGGLNWSNIGAFIPGQSTSTGINWYNEENIQGGNPGGQNLVAWSRADDNAWNSAKHTLDVLPNGTNQRKKVRFRIAFGSNANKQLGGFAFSNLKIEERNRILLVENFTNEKLPTNVFSANNNGYKNFNSNEIIRIQYNTSFPGEDAINKANPADHNARASFYGILNNANVPLGYVDGLTNGDFSTNWYLSNSQLRSLIASDFAINIITQVGAPGTISATVNVKALNPIPAGKRINLFVAIVEKQTGNETIMRKLLPSAAGLPIQLPLSANQSVPNLPVFNWEVTQGINPNKLAIVAFIQEMDESKDIINPALKRRDVLQSYVLLNPTNLPTVVTGLEPTTLSSLSFYPVPADKELVVSLPEAAQSQTPFVMYDAVGKAVHHTAIEKGQQTKTINTQDFAPGVYLIQLETDKGTVRKKVMVVH